MIKAIIFDVGGVLAMGKYSLFRFRRHPLGKSFHEDMARRLKIDMDTWFDAIMDIHDGANEGRFTKMEALRKMARNLNVNPSRLERLFRGAYRKTFVKNRKLMNAAYRMRKLGYQIAILSDQWPVPRDIIVDGMIGRNFDDVVISCEVKMKKPDLRIYKLLLKRLGVKAKEAVFIDNREWNLKPARKLGMKAILFENNKQVFRDLKKIGVKLK